MISRIHDRVRKFRGSFLQFVTGGRNTRCGFEGADSPFFNWISNDLIFISGKVPSGNEQIFERLRMAKN